VTWTALTIVTIAAGFCGGCIAGAAHAFTAAAIEGWKRRRAEAAERRARAEVEREWCSGCGQRREDGDHEGCA
jgi:hypothetical protein